MKTEQEHKNVQCTMNNVQWRKVKLGEVCFPSSEKYNPLTENIFQYCIEMENINQEIGTINGKSEIAKLLSLKTKFHKGDVLYGKLRPYLRKYWLADFDGACSTEIWVLKNAENIDNQFLFYLFQAESINKIANLSSGTKMPRADWKFMEKQDISIPFKNNKPDLSTQRRIAAILTSADKVIDSTRRLVEKYKKMKQGMMEGLFNEQCTMNNVHWKMVKLGECCEDVFSGKNTKRQDFGKYVVYGSTGPIGYSEDYEYDFDAVLVARVGANAGLVNKVSGLYDVSDNTLIIKILRNIDLNYMYYLLIRLNLNQFIFGSGQPLVTAGLLKKIEIPIPYKNDKPDLAEQRRIAAILSGIDAKIAAEEKVLEKYEKVKKGLMEKLLESDAQLVEKV